MPGSIRHFRLANMTVQGDISAQIPDNQAVARLGSAPCHNHIRAYFAATAV
ncbi:MAG: hypothetical protein GDA53_02345 [Rhodobacteraceae bacterium]|nr:hypothetical protein [Paracoccaceae bacterium]